MCLRISGGRHNGSLGNATNLCAGTVYTITAYGCERLHWNNKPSGLIAPNAPTITINTTTPVTCVPGCDGTRNDNNCRWYTSICLQHQWWSYNRCFG
ncbi:MAG: hypothetical protein IPG85_10040 [Bacteroidetes bacterium]|nr:hypothetical protein [Bacteroidota bacterium]